MYRSHAKVVPRIGVATVLALSAGVLFPCLAAAQTVTLPAVADAYIRQGGSNQNQGQNSVLQIQQSGGNRALVRMDPLAITAAVGIGSLVSATLELYATSSGNWGSAGRTVDLHRLTAGWTEAGVTWNCAADTIPSNSQPNCAAQWAGGTFEPEASDSVLHINTTSGYVQYNVTEDVRSFLAGTAPNYGWLAKLADETSSGNVDYVSREGLSTRRPRLVLVVESLIFDQVPPSLTITSPSHDVLVNETAPPINLSYADGGSGVALSSLVVKVDGVTASCAPGAATALCTPSPLTEGNHTITVSLRDRAGNEATASRSFTLLVGPGRRTTTFPATGDTYIRQGNENKNFGDETAVRIRQSGKNRSLVRFDAAEISQVIGQGTLVAARLELTIVKNGRNWSRDGRTVDAHRLTAAWTETGATWNCGIDTQPANSQANCSPQWAGGTFQAAPTASVLHTNDLSGIVSFDVTADVAALLAGSASQGWLLKKTVEGASGLVDYASREAGAATAPRLVVFFDVPAGNPDTTAPVIAITAPSGTVYYDPAPRIRVEYSDAGSGVASGSLAVSVDGQALAGCVAGTASAVCTPPALAAGYHQITAEIADLAGNHGTTSASFQLVLDGEPPVLRIAAPEPRVEQDTTPAVLVEFSDGVSGVDPATLEVKVDGASIRSSCTLSTGSAACEPQVLGAGSHTVTAEIADHAGNHATASSSFDLVIDQEQPELQIAAPGPLVEGDATPAVVLDYSDDLLGVDLATLMVSVDGASIRSTCSVSVTSAVCETPVLAEGQHTIAAEIADRAGNRATASSTFELVLDAQPPVLRIVSPTAGRLIGETRPRISLEYSDVGSGLDLGRLSVTLDGEDITSQCEAGPQSATCQPSPLGSGLHDLKAAVEDRKGQRTEQERLFEIALQLSLDIESPTQGLVTTAATVDITGTVAPEATSVTVVGIEGTPQNGRFTLSGVPLNEGGNTLAVMARTEGGGIGSATVTVIRDTTAPFVVIASPRNGLVTTETQVTVTGEFVDALSSHAAQPAPEVKVNGFEAQREGRTFLYEGLVLQPGENRIQVTVTDAQGNERLAETTVTLDTTSAQRIETLLGNGQEGRVGERLPEPLVVRLRDVFGVPLPGRRVQFEVSRGSGRLISGAQEESKLTSVTDENGQAQVDFVLGDRAGAGNHEVTVTSAGFPGTVVFCASARTVEPARIVSPVGDDQTSPRFGAVSTPYPKPLLTQVFDARGNPVAGVPVTYRVLHGGGSFDGQPEVTSTTNHQGVATATFTLGPLAIANDNMVEATFPGLAELPVIFTFTGLIPGPEEETAVVGLVLDNQDDPVPGVTLSIVGTDRQAVSDDQGRFRITRVPPGFIGLHIDGRTTSRPGIWAQLEFHFTAVPGADNSIGRPIRLLPIDVDNGRIVGGDEEVVVPMRGVPGASLILAPHSVHFPDGSTEGRLSFTQVHSDKVPMIAPMGSGFTLAFTVQPTGTQFDPPATVTLPNIGLPPGTEIDLFSFDHDLGEFLSIGTATVTPDGRLLRSNPGFGIDKAGWGGATPPPPPLGDGCHPGDGPRIAPKEGTECGDCVNGKPVMCKACQECEGGKCKDWTIEKMVPTMADGKMEKRYQAKDQPVSFSAMPKGTCKELIYAWDFNDPQATESDNLNTSAEKTPTHKFKKPGAYTVKVTVSCNNSAATPPAPCPNVQAGMGEIKVLIFDVDLKVQDLPEEDKPAPNEEEPGFVLGVRDEGKPKFRAPLKVVFEGPQIDKGVLKLEATAGQDKLRVYQSATGGTALPLPKTWQIRNGNFMDDLFVEAAKPSDSVKDLELKLSYLYEGAMDDDSAKGTAVEVDLRVDSDNDGSVTDADDQNEKKTPGLIVLANEDDDNGNNMKDGQESATVNGEDDLFEMKLNLKPTSLAGLMGLKLEIVPSGQIKVWKDSSKANALAPGTMLTIGTDQIPDTLWLEGVQPGQGMVEAILKNGQGQTISDDLVQVVVVKVMDIDVHGSDAQTFKTPSVMPSTDLKTKLHFVSAWKQGDVVLEAEIMPDLPEIRKKVEWEAMGGPTLTTPGVGTDRLTTRFSSTVGRGIKVPIALKIVEKKAKEVVAWVVSADVSGSVSAPTEQSVTLPNTTLLVGMTVEATIQPVATIFPSEIVSDADRPDLSGPYTTPPPPPGGTNVCTALLSSGANARWDITRRVAIRATRNPMSLTIKCFDNTDNYPGDPEKIIGNDDAGTNDPEDNDPYSAPGLGELIGFDKPARQGPDDGLLTNGNVGDTYRVQLWFEEFARLQLGNGSSGRWFAISDPLPWRVDYSFKKIQITEALWNGDVNRDGDMMDDVTEAMLGRDQNGDGDQMDNVGYWGVTAKDSANNNDGKP